MCVERQILINLRFNRLIYGRSNSTHFLVMADDMTRNLTIARLLMSLDDQHMAMVIGLVAFYQAPSYEEGYVCKSLPTMKCMQY